MIPDERMAEIRAAAGIDNEPGTFTQFLTLALREVLAELEQSSDADRLLRERRARDAAAQRKYYQRKHPGAKSKPRPEDLQPCGTPAAYQRHLRNAQPVCADCKAAWRKYQADYQARRKVAAQ